MDESFATGDDFISFDLDPGEVIDIRSSSPPLPVEEPSSAPSPAPAEGSQQQRKKRKSEGGNPDPKRQKGEDGTVGPRNLKEERRAAERAAPWADDVDWKHLDDPAALLNAEVHAFYNHMSPTAKEFRVRKTMIEVITHVIRKEWRDAQVIPFGSWETQLYLPTGDIDLVVSNPRLTDKNKVQMLHQLARMMRGNNITETVAVITRAKVPIIKFVTLEGGLNVDISLNQTNGVSAVKIVNNYLAALPGARELILVIKAFLNQRSMNEVYTGGLGSYSVICLAISFLQMHPKVRHGEMDPVKNLGVLLVEFFELYGRSFNYDEVGISVRKGGRYYTKRSRGWYIDGQPFLLCIEDPQDTDNDVAKSSFGIRQVKMTFGGAYDLLQARLIEREEWLRQRNRGKKGEKEPIDPQALTILGAIMGVTKETTKFRQGLAALDDSGKLQRRLNTLRARDGELDSGVLEREPPAPDAGFGAINVEDSEVEDNNSSASSVDEEAFLDGIHGIPSSAGRIRDPRSVSEDSFSDTETRYAIPTKAQRKAASAPVSKAPSLSSRLSSAQNSRVSSAQGSVGSDTDSSDATPAQNTKKRRARQKKKRKLFNENNERLAWNGQPMKRRSGHREDEKLGPTEIRLRSDKGDAARRRRDFWAAKGVLEDDGEEDEE